MKRRNTHNLLPLLIALVLTPVGVAQAEGPSLQSDQNLLSNPGFEGEYVGHDPIGNIKVAPDWTPWYVEGSEEEQAQGYGRVAEFFPATEEFYPGHTHDGTFAQGMKHTYGAGANGIYQQVTVPSNARLRFSAWGRGYSCQPPGESECPGTSINPSYLGMQIGIDPNGGTNFYASSVVFSKGTSAYDHFEEFVVEATANGTLVTVFITYHPDYPVQQNRVVWDTASLTATGTGGTNPTTSSPATTTAPAASPEPATTTTTTQPTTTYTVRPGDTLFRIATNNGTTTSALINLNGPTYPGLYSNPNLIYVGWVFRLASGATGGNTTGTTASTSGKTYVVQAGDYLTKIARANGTTASQLISLNSATYPSLTTNPDLIKVGWVLKLP